MVYGYFYISCFGVTAISAFVCFHQVTSFLGPQYCFYWVCRLYQDTLFFLWAIQEWVLAKEGQRFRGRV